MWAGVRRLHRSTGTSTPSYGPVWRLQSVGHASAMRMGSGNGRLVGGGDARGRIPPCLRLSSSSSRSLGPGLCRRSRPPGLHKHMTTFENQNAGTTRQGPWRRIVGQWSHWNGPAQLTHAVPCQWPQASRCSGSLGSASVSLVLFAPFPSGDCVVAGRQRGPLGTILFLLRTAPRDHQPPTTNRHQPPPTASRQPPPTASGDQPPTANHCQPPPTTNHQSATAANHHQPPVANPQPLIATNRQPPIATNHD